MPKLIRILSLRDLLLLFVGSVIGSGLFLVPGGILRQVGGSVALALLVWVAGGVLSLLGALTYAELSASNPEAGGLYCFIRDAFGPLSAFLYGWSLFLVMASASIAALARAFSTYAGEVIPLSPLGAKLLALAMVAVLTAVNVWGTRKSSDLQNSTTFAKAGVILVISAILLSLGHHFSESARAIRASQPTSSMLSSFGLAMIAVLWAYEGWQFCTFSGGEVLDPQRNFPRAFLAGMLSLIGIYVLANVAYLAALGPTGAAASESIAATSISAVLGSSAGKIVALTILVSTFSAANSIVLTAPRVFYAMAADKLFFRKLAEVHPRFLTPAFAVTALGAWSAVLTIAGSFTQLIQAVIFFGWIFYGLGAATIFPLRRMAAGSPRPYSTPGYPWTPALFIVAAAALVGNAIYAAVRDPNGFKNLTAGFVFLVLGLPAYYLWRWRIQHSGSASA